MPTQHRINESAVLTLVSDTLRAIAEYSRNDRTEFIHTVQETQVAQQSADISKKRRRLAAAQKRAGELEKLICKIYEDKIKAKKKAEMDAKKALIRAEDMKKGVFSTIGQLPKEEPRKGSIAASAAV